MRQANRRRKIEVQLALAVCIAAPDLARAAITATGQVTPATGASPWTATGIIVGNTGVGALTVDAGSDIIANTAVSTTEPALALGYTASGVGTLNLTGSGSTITSNGDVAIGYRGAGTLNVSSSATITTASNKNFYVAGFVVNSGVANSNLAVTSGGRVTSGAIVSMNIPNPSPNTTTYQLDIGSGGVVKAGTTFQITGSSSVSAGTGRMRIVGSGSKLDANFGAALGYSGKLTAEVNSGGSIVTGGALDIGYQGETQFTASNATITASSFTAGYASGFANIALGTGTVFTVQNTSDFGNGGRTITTIGEGARFDSAGTLSIGSGANATGSVVSVSGATTIFRSNARLNVGGNSTSRRGTLGLSGATAQGQTGILVDRGGLVTGTGTLSAPSGAITIDGVLETIPNVNGTPADLSLHLNTSGNASTMSSAATLRPQLDISGGNLRIGKLTVDNHRLTVAGTLDLEPLLTSSAPTTATQYVPQTIIDASTGSASYTGRFTSFPAMKIDSNTSWVITYASRTVTLQRAKIGDADLDKVVNFDDLIILAQNYNLTNRTWAQGDFTGDGRVNFDDLIPLAQHYQSSGPAGVSGDGFAADWALAQSLVPEPSTFIAVTALTLGGLRRAKRIKTSA